MSDAAAKKSLADELVRWAKAVAIAEGSDKLDLHHVLVGALKFKGGRRLLAEIMKSDLPLRVESLDERFRDLMNRAQQPPEPSSAPVPLTDRLKESVSRAWRSDTGLDPEQLLKAVLLALENDCEWGKPLLEAARNYPHGGWCGTDLVEEILEREASLKEALQREVIGQERAIEIVCDAYVTSCREEVAARNGRPFPRRGPKMLFTFVGPSGVGKTYLAECLACHLRACGEGKGFLRLDMSAYSGHQAHEQLIGFSEAYKGSDRGILTGFAVDNPEGFVLVDEIEKAHLNTQNLFLQILDSGFLYDNRLRKNVDFSCITMVFTSNLGSELYDAPNRSGILREARNLSDTVIEALRKESRVSSARDGQGLSPALVSRLQKGQVVLFERLDGPALERISAQTLERLSAKLENAVGLRLEVSNTLIHTLFVLSFGAGGDARSLVYNLRYFLNSVVNDGFRDPLVRPLQGSSDRARELKGFRFMLPDEEPFPEGIRSAVSGRSRLLLIDDDVWPESACQDLEVFQARDEKQADECLRRQQPDLVLLDLHLGSTKESRSTERGLTVLGWLRSRWPEQPVYLFSESPEKRGLSPEALERVREEGGARGILVKRFAAGQLGESCEKDDFLRSLKELALAQRRHSLIARFQRQGKVLKFESHLKPEAIGSDGIVPVELRGLREISVVSSLDRNNRGWVDLPKDRFEDIAGADQAKKRLKEIAGWLKDARPIRDMGLDLPKGILLTGRPGTGKTTLARALAGEAEVPFFAISGSQVFSRWVGESEAALRELFQCARRYAPSVIFIDEIDSLGVTRSSEANHDYRISVLNELLAQMDGFEQPDRPVFVLAATNRPEILDPALVRAGRFDLQIEVETPGVQDREEIFRIHLRNVRLDGDLDLAVLSKRTAGMSGAEIRQVCKEAGLLALREGSGKVAQKHLQEAVTNIQMGLASDRVVLDEETRRNVAVHEAGHLVAHHVLFPEDPVAQVSILPRGKALGFCETVSGLEYREQTLERIMNSVMVWLAGHEAEALLTGPGKVSTGCAHDLERATALALEAVSCWGIDPEIGPVSLRGVKTALAIGKESGVELKLQDQAVERARQWLCERQREVRVLLEQNRSLLERIVGALVEKETLYAEELGRLLKPGWGQNQ